MARRPDQQPYADAVPILYPRGPAFSRRLLRTFGNLSGAILLVAIVNIAAVTYISGFSESPYNYLRIFLERVAVSRIVAATAAGEIDGERIAQLRSEVRDLRSERDSLKLLIDKSSLASHDTLSISKLEMSEKGLYWQVLVRPRKREAGELLLDVRRSDEPVVPSAPAPSAMVIPSKGVADLHDGIITSKPGRHLVVSLFSKTNKTLIEAKIAMMRQE